MGNHSCVNTGAALTIPSIPMLDAHCHLDSYCYPHEVACELCSHHISLFSMPIHPSSRQKTLSVLRSLMTASVSVQMPNDETHLLQDSVQKTQVCVRDADQKVRAGVQNLASKAQVRIGIGMHPWWIDDTKRSLAWQHETFQELEDALGSRDDERVLIGEIGLDFGPSYRLHKERQLRFFEELLCMIQGRRSCILSVHAVQSASSVIDLLMRYRTCDEHLVVFHWFSGSGADLVAARKLGCLFSVNERMLTTKRGRAYVSQIPVAQLLFETDGPQKQWRAASASCHREALYAVAEQTAMLHRCSIDELLMKMISFQELMSPTCGCIK